MLLPVALLGTLLILIHSCESKLRWDYELLSISSFSNDASKLAIQSKIERSKYNDLSFTLIIDWLYDLKDTDMCEMNVFRSQSGLENDFRPLPYSIPKISLMNAKEQYYKDFIYDNIGHCSNFPTYEEIENIRWPQNRYVLERCVLTGKGLPEILPEGTYKAVLKFTGDFDWGVTFVAKLRSKIIP